MLCYIHIERAGGTTLQHLFRYNYPFTYVMLTPWFLWANEPGNVFTAREARVLLRAVPGAWGFGGHSVRTNQGYAEAIGQPVRYVTFLRDPVARYISHFNYQRNVMGIPWSLDDYLQEPRFRNWLTRRFAGQEDLEEAKRVLREDMAFVGFVERFDESLVLMRQRLEMGDFDPRYERKNASPNPGYQRDPRLSEPDVRRRMEAMNALDMELVEYARTHVYPRYVQAYPGDLTADVERFQRTCEGFRFKRRRRALWAGYRFFYYRNLEGMLYRWYHRS